MENHGNLILIDWFTGRSCIDSVESIIELLGMTNPAITWQNKDAYMNGYPYRTSFEGIHILYGAADDMGVCITMSGQGCRTFETYGHGLWSVIFDHFISHAECNVTRLDLAFDDHTGILPLDQMIDDTVDHAYTSKSRYWEVRHGSTGTTIYHGSPQSNIRFRIYDKALERGLLDGTHWVRLEMQLRQENAVAMCKQICSNFEIGHCFLGVLKNYLVYRTPTGDSNKARWPIADYWLKLIDGIESLHLWETPGTEYNVFNLQHFLVHQCAGPLLTWHNLFGLEDLLTQIQLNKPKLAPKYQKLLAERVDLQ